MRIADVSIVEESDRCLVFESKRGPGRCVFAAVLVGVAAWFVYGAVEAGAIEEAGWRWVAILYNALPAAFFAVVAFVIGFGRERCTLDAGDRSACLVRGLGPVNWSKAAVLPQSGIVRVTFEKTRVGSTEHWRSQTIYTVRLSGVEWFDLTSVDDRDMALATAARIAGFLGYTVENLAGDDGIERRPA